MNKYKYEYLKSFKDKDVDSLLIKVSINDLHFYIILKKEDIEKFIKYNTFKVEDVDYYML